MNILLVAATPYEIAPFHHYLTQHWTKVEETVFQQSDLRIQLLITGVGQLLTAYAMSNTLAQRSFDLLLNAGVAGAFDRNLALGDVVHVVTEQLGDLGAEDKDGRFLDVHFNLQLIEANAFPFRNGKLINEAAMPYEFLPKVDGLTVNKVHGNVQSIAAIQQRYDVAVESMEGAAFFYAALQHNTPFLEIRSISNYVEARNKDNWKLGLAIERLNEVLQQFVVSLN